MSLEQLNDLPFKNVPASDRPVRGAREQDLAQGVRGHAGDGPGVLLERLQAFPRLKGEALGREVRRARDQNILITIPVEIVDIFVIGRDEDERVDSALVSREDPNALPRVEVPAAGGPVVGGREDEVARADDAVD